MVVMAARVTSDKTGRDPKRIPPSHENLSLIQPRS
jgi:hypothetical protein